MSTEPIFQFSGMPRRQWQWWRKDYVTYWVCRSGFHRLRIELRSDGYCVKVNGSGWAAVVEKSGGEYVAVFGTFEQALRLAGMMLGYAERNKRIVTGGYVVYSFIENPGKWWTYERNLTRYGRNRK